MQFLLTRFCLMIPPMISITIFQNGVTLGAQGVLLIFIPTIQDMKWNHIWNSLPYGITDSDSTDNVKLKIKNHICKTQHQRMTGNIDDQLTWYDIMLSIQIIMYLWNTNVFYLCCKNMTVLPSWLNASMHAAFRCSVMAIMSPQLSLSSLFIFSFDNAKTANQ